MVAILEQENFRFVKRSGFLLFQKMWKTLKQHWNAIFHGAKKPEKCIDLSPVFPYCVEEKTPLLFPRIMIIYQIKISLTVCSKTNHYAKQSIYNYHYYHNRYELLKRIGLVHIVHENFFLNQELFFFREIPFNFTKKELIYFSSSCDIKN